MEILFSKKMYLPAVSIVAGVLVLLALLGVSTYRNLNRQRAAAMEVLYSQANTLLEALEAGARTGMMLPMWSEDSVDTLIKEVSRNESISYISLVQSGWNNNAPWRRNPAFGNNSPFHTA